VDTPPSEMVDAYRDNAYSNAFIFINEIILFGGHGMIGVPAVNTHREKESPEHPMIDFLEKGLESANLAKYEADLTAANKYLGVSIWGLCGPDISDDKWEKIRTHDTFDLMSILKIKAYCPVDISVTDPDNKNISKSTNEILGAKYSELDLNNDGSFDDLIIIPNMKNGIYTIEIIPEPDAEPTDRYTLEVTSGETTTLLAEDVPISEIPDQPYIFQTLTIFDTGLGTYPSIMGTHKGEIKPSCNINVSKLYTYPCAGTGGHTESIELYENSTLIANGTWEGYAGDWHNITLHNVSGAPYVMLLKGHRYNYTIITGSYPQIHHTDALPTKNGWINCTEFVDANGKVYYDWIPAIKLS